MRHGAPSCPAHNAGTCGDVLHRQTQLVAACWGCHLPGMFTVTEAEAAAIRAIFDQEGELLAAIELRRLFPGITDNSRARMVVRQIAG